MNAYNNSNKRGSALTDEMAAVISAGFAAIGVMFAAWITTRPKTKSNHEALEYEFKQRTMDFSSFLQDWPPLHQDIKALIDETCIDRFIIFRAFNGLHKPTHTTAVFEIRAVESGFVYIRVPLDSDYTNRMERMETDKRITFQTSELPPSVIKDIYQAEGVKSSHWAYIETKDIPHKKGAKAVTYCSYSTHGDDPISPEVVTRCNLLVNRLQGVASLHGIVGV